jgi:sporulation protein YlmC with PRC-barrel domain
MPKMVLYSELKDFKVINSLGDDKGKLAGLIVDLSNWNVKNLIISPRILKKKVVYKMEDMKEVKEHDKKIVISNEMEEGELPEKSSLVAAFVEDDLLGKEVVTSDGHEIGKIYDFDVPLKLKNWTIWKILIKRGIKERRLRLGQEDIHEISENVMLKKSLSEIESDED